jgi:hypothetical protein
LFDPKTPKNVYFWSFSKRFIQMISGLLKKIFGDKTAKERKEYQPIIDKANEFFNSFKSISDDELRARTVFFQNKASSAVQWRKPVSRCRPTHTWSTVRAWSPQLVQACGENSSGALFIIY